MNTKAKTQTNKYDVNVLVETQHSTNKHYSHLDKNVTVTNVLTDNEIIEVWKNRSPHDDLEFAKAWIKKQPGYAVSDCVDETVGIDYGSIVEYD